MDEEFDTSLDTSSFDDIAPDTSDIGSFDEANDIVSVMDEAIDTSSFDTSENLDTIPDTSDDIGSLMDGVPPDTNSIEELDIEETPTEIEELPPEADTEIESLMDNTDRFPDDISTSELSDTPESEFPEELSEQSEIDEVSVDSSLDADTETSEISDSELTEISEQESNEINDLMNETPLEDMTEETVIQNESETSDIPHDEISETENDTSEIIEPEIESLMSEGETYDIPHDNEGSDNIGDTDDSSEISDLMDVEDVSSEAEQEIDSEQPDAEEPLDDIGDNVPASQEIEETDTTVDRGPDNFESSPETLENPSQYETVGEFAPKQPGDPEAWDMSDVPSFEEHMNDVEGTDVTDAVTETEADIPTETESSSFDRLYDYMSSHNYGREDYAEYSKDPEWQELNNAYLVSQGKEPIDYGQSGNNEFVEDMHDQVTEGWGIPEDSPEYDAIMENEQEISNINSQETMEIDENTDVVPEVGEQTEIQEIAPIEKIDEWLKEINPNYDAFDIESPYCNNCGSCAYSVYRRLEGETGAVASAENIGYNSEMEALTGMEQVSMSPADIEQRLLEQGAGSHAIIGIDRAEGPGHWFNAANIDGKVVAIDGQDGSISDWPPDYGDVVNWEMSIRKEA